MDIKRYGIEITHIQGTNAPKTLIVNDPRLAIQLPQEVILAGLEANPRPSASSTTATASALVDDSEPTLVPEFINAGGNFTRIKE